MSGAKSNLKDLAKAFNILKASNGADLRKAAIIEEFRQAFLREGKTALEAHNLAIEKYNQIHK